ncbi:TetR/AcrR family transcriptional regulator [Cytobacillus horneckiae]|uniref:TetR-like C-terminal domain-containing protein n=1 Tax=Cytobacillus horneckiae TaxID=549687 RepID=UPI00203A7D9F|nr:TetR/AcrR family transcriptional regulator [Cytobacillus horneckiae]MCM3177420.1 TetR/AcrR family transcriptional regulator [Cytobacillus horneckiae]
MNKKDPRVQQTFEMLQGGFTSLIQAMPLEQITIKKLTEASLINRTTFYLHFSDLQDFILQYCETIFTKWTEISNHAVPTPLHRSLDETYPGLVNLLEHIKQGKIMYSCLLVEHRLPQFTSQLNEWMKKYTNQGFGVIQPAPHFDDYEREVREAHILSGTIGAIIWWVKHSFPITSQRLAEELTKIAAKGPFYVSDKSSGSTK